MKLIFLLVALLSPLAFAAQYSTGLVIPENWASKAHFSSPFLGEQLPAAYDWRKVAVLPPIKNQGQCGSCWAFASTAAFQDQIAIHQGGVQDLAEQELVDCESGSYGCSGGFFAFDYQVDNGQTFTKNFPYHAADTACRVNGLPHDFKAVKWGYVGDGQTQPSTEQIKAQILATGPVAVTVCANNKFMNYTKGVLSGGSCQTNHMTVLEGWDDSTGSWIMRNSWGTAWGEKGYMRIKYGSNSIGEMAAWVSWQK